MNSLVICSLHGEKRHGLIYENRLEQRAKFFRSFFGKLIQSQKSILAFGKLICLVILPTGDELKTEREK